ncbi:MAG: hypothetical protein KGL58_05160, partial [Pseudomonadota bacterium]|nr:hypothetical protein [Pseudomonadota bacterium]
MRTVANYNANVAKAAFIADISEREANRIVDENILPSVFFDVSDNGRKFSLLGCALASFYFREEELLSKKARQMAANVIAERVEKYRYRNELLSLTQ